MGKLQENILGSRRIPKIRSRVGEGNHSEPTIPGWWLGTFFIFPYIGNNHPN
jgi:hypothetical protein